MTHHIGTDIIEIARIKEAVARWGERFLNRVYTGQELELYRQDVPTLAAYFAGKEAVIKALSPKNKRIGWREIEILRQRGGKPYVNLYGEAQNQAERLGLDSLDISLSHSREYAIAAVIGATE